MSVEVADAIRELVMSFSAFTVGLTAIIVITMVRRLRRHTDEKNIRQLLMMLTAAGLAFMMLHIGVIEQAISRFGTEPTWRTPFYLLASLFSTFAIGLFAYYGYKSTSMVSMEERAERVRIMLEIKEKEGMGGH